jgi:hypothetical protein
MTTPLSATTSTQPTTASTSSSATPCTPFSPEALELLARPTTPGWVAVKKIELIQTHFQAGALRFSDTLDPQTRTLAGTKKRPRYAFPHINITTTLEGLPVTPFEGLPVMPIETFEEQSKRVAAWKPRMLALLVGTDYLLNDLWKIVADYATPIEPRINLCTQMSMKRTQPIAQVIKSQLPFDRGRNRFIEQDLSLLKPARTMAAIVLMPTEDPRDKPNLRDNYPPEHLRTTFSPDQTFSCHYLGEAPKSTGTTNFQPCTALKEEDIKGEEEGRLSIATAMPYYFPEFVVHSLNLSKSELPNDGAIKAAKVQDIVFDVLPAPQSEADNSQYKNQIFDQATCRVITLYVVGVCAEDLDTVDKVRLFGQNLCRLAEKIQTDLDKAQG